MGKKLYDPSKRKGSMRVACFMSGSGSNVIKILENQEDVKKAFGSAPYEVVFLFSDRKDLKRCKIKDIAFEKNIPYEVNDIWDFYKERGHENKRDMGVRAEYDLETVKFLKEHDVDAIALAGYMSIVTKEIFNLVPTINVHPADLTIEENGKRKYIGDNAVRDAIISGEEQVASSTLLVNESVDGGPLLLVSKSLKIDLPFELELDFLRNPENKSVLTEITDRNQNGLKKVGDWVIFPRTLEYLGNGQIEIDDDGKISIKGKPAPLKQ